MLRPKIKLILFSVFVCLTLSIMFLYKKNKSVFVKPIVTNKIQIITTLFPLYDFAKNIGQDKVSVSLLLPPGTESHSFDPKPNDVIKINQADIFIFTSKTMEPWAKDLLSGITNKNLLIVDSNSNIQLVSQDPHVWLNLINAQKMVDTIANSLVSKDPVNKLFYETNAQNYKQKLIKLDQDYQFSLNSCRSKKIIYGGHYAFAYLAQRYSLHYSSAQGISPDSEPTAKDLASLISQIKKDNLKYIFYEELSSPKVADTIARETGTKLLFLNAAHNISKEQFDQGLSFVSIFESNLSNLKTGLECQ